MISTRKDIGNFYLLIDLAFFCPCIWGVRSNPAHGDIDDGIEWDLMEYINGYNDICVICFFGTVPFFHTNPVGREEGNPHTHSQNFVSILTGEWMIGWWCSCMFIMFLLMLVLVHFFDSRAVWQYLDCTLTALIFHSRTVVYIYYSWWFQYVPMITCIITITHSDRQLCCI